MANSFKALGVTGRAMFGSPQPMETDADLTGSYGAAKFAQMRRADAMGAAMYGALSLPVRMAVWRCDPASEAQADVDAAEFVWSAFSDMSHSFSDFVGDICLFFIYGWADFWVVLKRRTAENSCYPDGKVGFRKMEMVAARSVVRWETDAKTGDIAGPVVRTNEGKEILVPLAGSLFFRTSREGDDPEGISIYRPAVRAYEYKKRLERTEGSGLDRRWRGFPVVKMPLGATTRQTVGDGEISDEQRAEELIEAIYKDTVMGAFIPAGWEIDFGGPQGSIDNTMSDTIKRKEMEMARAILAQWLMLGQQSVGTQALASTLMDAFATSVEAFLTIIRDELNLYAVPYLLKYNDFSGLTGLPTMEFTSPRQVNIAAVGDYVRALTRGGMLTPDAPTEDYLRSLLSGMPPALEHDEEEEPTQGDGGNDNSKQGPDKEPASSKEGDAAAVAEEPKRSEESVTPVTFSTPPPSSAASQYHAMANSNAAAQRTNLESWAGATAQEIAGLDPDLTTEASLRQKMDDLVLAGLLLMRDKSVVDISAAFWLGYGQPSGPPEMLMVLQQEISGTDAWLGYGAGDVLRRSNPAGKPTMFGDIAGEMEGRIAAILLLLKQGRKDEAEQEVLNAVRSATQGFHRAELYSGSVWHAIWAGSRGRADIFAPVRWVNDPLARHCRQCIIFGSDPPGKEYPSWDAMETFTGGILPGLGTDCDGNCRCHLEVVRADSWVWA